MQLTEKQKSDIEKLVDIQLDLFYSGHRSGSKAASENAFDVVSVAQSCELVRFCLKDHDFYKMETERFRWVNEGLFLVKRVLSNIYNNKYYRDVCEYAEKSIRKHPLCVAWKRIMDSP